MRLGKKKEKEKEAEPRSQNVEGVSRLICSARASHNTPIKSKSKYFLFRNLIQRRNVAFKKAFCELKNMTSGHILKLLPM